LLGTDPMALPADRSIGRWRREIDNSNQDDRTFLSGGPPRTQVALALGFFADHGDTRLELASARHRPDRLVDPEGSDGCGDAHDESSMQVDRGSRGWISMCRP